MNTDFAVPSQGALYMLARGFKILPLTVNGKEAVLANWPEGSKNVTAGYVESTFDNRNWGVHPGLTGHFVVDVDNKKGKNGSKTWADLVNKHGGCPATFTVQTPTGGLHYYFAGRPAGCNVSLGEGVDTRALNGYVVAPGGQIGDDFYKIIDDRAVAEAPAWLVDLIVPTTKVVTERPAVSELDVQSEIARAVEWLQSAAPAIEGNSGDNQTFSVGCQMRDFGLSEAKALELMLEHWNPRCEPPWSTEELTVKIDNAYRYAQNSLGAKTQQAALAEAADLFGAEPVANGQPTEKISPLRGMRGSEVIDATLKPCEWVIENHLATSFISVLTAPPGTGKSSFGMLKAFAIVTGSPLLGPRHTVKKRGPVLLYNGEDALDKMQRDLAAQRQHLGLSLTDTKNIVLISGASDRLVVAKKSKSRGAEINRTAVDRIVEAVQFYGAVACIFDPLIETHSVEENSNEEMSVVMGAFREIATGGACAVEVVHHTSKAALNTDKADTSSQGLARGASAIVGAARLAHNLTTMGAKEAASLGIAETDRRAYYKCEMTKTNISAWDRQPEWYRIGSAEIANGQAVGFSAWDAISEKGAREAGEHAIERENVFAILRREIAPGQTKGLKDLMHALSSACGLKPGKPAALVAKARAVLGDESQFRFTQPGDRKPWQIERPALDILS